MKSLQDGVVLCQLAQKVDFFPVVCFVLFVVCLFFVFSFCLFFGAFQTLKTDRYPRLENVV